jgi:hypothetical protein
MDNDPKTRQEKKGGKKGQNDSIYSSRRVRQMEAMMEKKGLNPSSSTSKIPPKTEPSTSKKQKR